jgi:hypothetical protein
MRIVVTVMVLALASAAVAARRAPRLEDATPSAADLLRAERRAEEVRKRLQVPTPKRTPRWLPGGGGWKDGRQRGGRGQRVR